MLSPLMISFSITVISRKTIRLRYL
jgi:hypothetical protein